MRASRIGVLAALAIGIAPAARAQTPPSPATPAAARQSLTLQQAEAVALQGQPQIQAAQYGAAAATEVVREAKSAYFPTVYGSITGADATTGSRIAAGGLNNPVIYNRFATGFTVGQLLTDFGRTSALVGSSSLTATAEEKTVDERKEDVLLRVNQAYFNVLRAQAVERVAQETVSARQIVADQVTALAASNLKSSLDVSFAKVNLGEAQLFLVQAQNDVQGAFAELSAALGSTQPTEYTLAEEPLPPAPPADATPLVAEALRQRPDVAGERFSAQAAEKFADAERSLFLPSVSLVTSFGMAPYHEIGLPDRYSAVGVNVNVPLTNGNLFAARRAEAVFRSEAANERVQDIETQVSRDVRVAWLDASTAYQRLALTDQILDQANQALDLAQARYNLGLSSIVELTQAQLNKTQAEIDQASARYDYQAKTAALRYQTGTLK